MLTKRVIFFDSGTSALFIALKIVLKHPQKKVFVNPNTCPAVMDSILSAGGTPFFLQTDEEGLTNLSLAYKFIEKNDGVLLLTNTYGFFDNWKKADLFAQSKNLCLINDLSQVNICSDDFLDILTTSKLSVLSFGPEKYIAGISGGALIIDSQYLTQNQNAQRILDELSCRAYDALFSKIIQRLKYVLTFHTVGTVLYQILIKLSAVNVLTNTKFPKDHTVRLNIIPLRMHISQTISVLIRILYYQRTRKKDLSKYRLLVRQIEHTYNIVRKDTQTAPSHAIIKVPISKRFQIAELLAKNGFQVTWNYIPLFLFEPFNCYSISSDKNDFWQQVVQVPYRFLSKRQINKLASVLTYASKIT